MPGNYAGDSPNIQPIDKKCRKALESLPNGVWAVPSNIATLGLKVHSLEDQTGTTSSEQKHQSLPITNKFDVNICTHSSQNTQQNGGTQTVTKRSGLFVNDPRPQTPTVSSRFPLPRFPSYQNRETQFLFMDANNPRSLKTYCFELFVKSCCVLIDAIFIMSVLFGGENTESKDSLWDWLELLTPKKPLEFSVIEPDMD